MKKIFKLFNNIDMNWKNVIIFSLAVGVFCGIFGGLPILDNTSFSDMAGGYEWWVVFAVIICVNCKKFYEAGLKCGVFFLITQPLQFFIQALLYSHNYQNAYYYFKMWLPIIILTVPGGMVAYFAKKQNIIGAVVLALGNTIEGISFISYLNACISNPPRHLIAVIFSFSSIIVMSLALQKKKVYRIIAMAVPYILCTGIVIYAKLNGLYI